MPGLAGGDVFTGIIEQQAIVQENRLLPFGNRLVLAATLPDLQIGESIAVNGVCLTVLPSNPNELDFDISSETLSVTTLGNLKSGDPVNMERAMSASSRFGGHYVSGHVDCKAVVHSIRNQGEFKIIEFSGFEPQAFLYLIPKGSITIEGVSLTINAVQEQYIQCMLIPHTLSHTSLGTFKVGQAVNIEFDYLARIVAHQLQQSRQFKQEVTTCL